VKFLAAPAFPLAICLLATTATAAQFARTPQAGGIWLAGTSRYLGSKAHLGFHSAATTLSPYTRSEKGNAAMAEFMTELGDVPQSIIDLQPKADPTA
jgi:hypothetical protein